jgi:HK97 family phage major capsid protein
MSNALLDRLTADYRETFARYDEICDRVKLENRDLTGAEEAELEGYKAILEPLGDRITDLRALEERRSKTILVPDDGGLAGPGSPATPGRRSKVPPLQVGDTQLRSVLAALQGRQAYNEPVEAMQTRAASLTPAGAVVPTWWPPVEYGVEGRLAEAISTRPAPDQSNQFDYLATTSPAVLADTAEGAAKPDAGLVLSRRNVALVKGAAHTDYSWELSADFEGVDAIINNEFAAGLIRWENGHIVSAIGGDPGILTPTITGTNPGLVQVFQAQMAVRAAPNVGDPDLVILHPNDWFQLNTELAATSGLFLSGTEAIVTGPEPMLWGMKVALTIAQAAGSCLLGVAAAAAWFMREGPRVIVDPYSQAVNNLTRVIYEERGAAGLLVPGRWAKFTFTGALAAEAEHSTTKK